MKSPQFNPRTKFPSPAEILSVRKSCDLTQAEAAALVHSNLRSWQYWESGGNKMHPAFWELFCIKSAALKK